MRMCVSGWSALVLVSCLASAAVGQRRDGVPIDRSADEVLSTVTEMIEPGYSGASRMLPSLTPAEVEQMRRRYLENREIIASRVNNNPIDPLPPSAWPSGPATAAGGDSSLAKSHGAAASLMVGQNYFNSLAASVGSNPNVVSLDPVAARHTARPEGRGTPQAGSVVAAPIGGALAKGPFGGPPAVWRAGYPAGTGFG